MLLRCYVSLSCNDRALLSFPTRRSSDLRVGQRWHALAVDVRQEGQAVGARGHLARRPLQAGEIGPEQARSEEHTSELQSPCKLVCRLLLEKKKAQNRNDAQVATVT